MAIRRKHCGRMCRYERCESLRRLEMPAAFDTADVESELWLQIIDKKTLVVSVSQLCHK